MRKLSEEMTKEEEPLSSQKIHRTLNRLVGTGVCLLALALFFFRLRHYVEQFSDFPKLSDFNHYYTTAWLLLQGSVPYGTLFSGLDLSLPFKWDDRIPSATNPPLLAMLTIPLATLDPQTAYSVWIGVNILATLGILMLLTKVGRENGLSLLTAVPLALCLLASDSFFVNLELGQSQCLILFLVLLGWDCERRGRHLMSAAIWGFAAALKIFPWPVVVFYFVRHRVNPGRAVSCGLFTVFFFALPALVFGPEMITGFVQHGLPIIQRSAGVIYENFSIGRLLSDLARFALPEELWKRLGELRIFDALPALFSLIFAVVAALSSSGDGRAMTGERPTAALDSSLALLLAFCFLGTPVAWNHYLVFLIFPAFVMYWRLRPGWFASSVLFCIYLCIFQRPSPDDYTSAVGYLYLNGVRLWNAAALFAFLTPCVLIWRRSSREIPGA